MHYFEIIDSLKNRCMKKKMSDLLVENTCMHVNDQPRIPVLITLIFACS